MILGVTVRPVAFLTSAVLTLLTPRHTEYDHGQWSGVSGRAGNEGPLKEDKV